MRRRGNRDGRIAPRAVPGPAWSCGLERGLALVVALLAALAALAAVQPSASAATGPVVLGTAANFAVLAASTVVNTGATTLDGDLGLSPGTSVTGFPPGQVNGATHVADSVASQAQTDLAAAYSDASTRPVTATIPTALGGTTQDPGVYDSAAGTFAINGILTLDGQGDPNAVFIFQAPTTLGTTAASDVRLINGAQASNVFWAVGTSATLGAGSTLSGSILALASITVATGALIDGRALSSNGAVTLAACTITDLFPGLTITKTADTGSTAPGSTVNYTIAVANSGQIPDDGATLTDSLTGVLDDAAYDNDAVATAGTVSFTSPDLTWTGDLALGQTATITYSVTVNDPDTGDLSLANTVSSATPGSNCPAGSSDPRCSVTVGVVIGVLSITAPDGADLGTSAPGGTASGTLGPVQVTDDRNGFAGWTATVSATDFTTGGGSAAETIPAADVRYLISGFTSTAGSATFTRTPETVLSNAAQAVVTATSVRGDNSAAWSPVIQVSVPSGAVAGIYTGTITHSVS
jgi:uncharacterized repeat protein (TIGR01451 family)